MALREMAAVAYDIKHIDVSDEPALLALAREVQKTDEPCMLSHEDEEIALLVPVSRAARLGIWPIPPGVDDETFRRAKGSISGDVADYVRAILFERRGPPDDLAAER